MADGSTRFTVDSQLLLELGERLVSRRSTALAELVKNAYDADATACTITLENVTKHGGRIIVEDDGLGISPANFESTWMRIATTDSSARPYSRKFRRPRTGAKGVGRFACRVLANKLTIESTSVSKAGRSSKISAVFDWAKFIAGSDVTKIPVSVKVTIVEPEGRTGTRLILEDLRNVWSQEDLQELRQGVMTLVSPFPTARPDQQGEDPGFDVHLNAPEFGHEKKLREELLRAALGVLEGEINVQGQPIYSLKFRGEPEKKFYTPLIKLEDIGPARCLIHYFVYAKANFAGASISMVDARELGRRQGGVRVYMDGFRVFKYGDPTDDWLGLDADRGGRRTSLENIPEELTEGLGRPALNLPGNNNLFGVVNVSRFTNPNLLLTVTRDRLFENKAFEQLKQFVRTGVNWMSVEYARYQRKKTPLKEVSQKELTQTREAIREGFSVLKESAKDPAVQQTVANLEETFQKTVTALEDSIGKAAMLEVLASTGTMVLVFEHELDQLVSSLKELAGELEEHAQRKPTDTSEIQRISRELDELAANQEELGIHIGLLTGVESRTKRQEIAIREAVNTLVRSFSRHMDRFGIEFENTVLPSTRTPKMYRCEFDSIILNLLSNSIKALKGATTRKIRLEADSKDRKLELRFLDSGPGVSPDKRDVVFEPFETFSTPDPVFGQGTGLGLTIVRDLVSVYAGEVAFIDPPTGWGACVRIVFPLEEI